MYLIVFSVFSLLTGIFNLSLQKLDGTQLPLNQFQGKKVLLVNIATGSRYSSQLAELEQLYQQHKDSLVVIGFPTNDFGKESRDNAALLQYFTDSVQVSFPIIQKTSVTGTASHPVYQWLADGAANGSGMNTSVGADFQKVLLDRNGKIHARFSGRIAPLDPVVQAAIASPAIID